MQDPEDESKTKALNISSVKCGTSHCLAKLDINAVLIWGANEQGQLGNKKRSYSDYPVFLRTFENDMIRNISAGYSSSGVTLVDKDLK